MYGRKRYVPEPQFQVGDLVRYYWSRSGDPKFSTVKEGNQRFVTLEDGTRWTAVHGRHAPKDGEYKYDDASLSKTTQAWIDQHTESKRREVELRGAYRELRGASRELAELLTWARDRHDLEDTRALVAALRPVKEAVDAKRQREEAEWQRRNLASKTWG